MGQRGPCVADIDLTPCYQVTRTANNFIARCRFCDAGWLPTGSSPAGPLIVHARTHHRRLYSLRLSSGLHNGMPIKIPTDARPVRDCRLDLIRVVTALADRLTDGTGSLKTRVKATMAAKGAAYAVGDLTVAALRAATSRSAIVPHDLYALVRKGKLSIEQFLECVTIRRKPLEQYLSGDQIDRITPSGEPASPSLVVEFKPGFSLDFDHLLQVISEAMVVPQPA